MRASFCLTWLVLCSAASCPSGKANAEELGDKIGTITKLAEATWGKKSSGLKVGSEIRINQLVDLTGGSAELSLEGGGTAKLDGASQLKWTDLGRARLDAGKLEVSIPDIASLMVDGPGIQIQTSGSHFKVNIGKGRTTVSTTRRLLYIKGRGSDPGVYSIDAGEQVVIDQKTGSGVVSKIEN